MGLVYCWLFKFKHAYVWFSGGLVTSFREHIIMFIHARPEKIKYHGNPIRHREFSKDKQLFL